MAQFTNLDDAQKEYNKLVREAIQLSSRLSDANSKALNLIYSQAKAANKIPQTLAEANKEVDILTGVIETLEDRTIKLVNSVSKLKDEWVDALNNLKNTSREAERAKGPFNNLESIVRKITYHRKGDQKLSSQNLTSLARQTLIEKTNLETSQAILQSKKRRTPEEREALKAIKETLKKNSKLYADQIDHAKKLSREQRNIEQGVGLTTKALKTTEGLLQKIGLTDLSSTFADATDASEAYINKVTLGGTKSANAAEKIAASFVGIGVVFQDLGKKFVDALVDPTTYFVGAVKLIGGAFSLIKNIVVGVFNLVKNIINSAIDFIKNLITEASTAYKEFATLISDEQTNISRSLGVPFRNAQKLHAEVLGMGATAASSVESFVAIQGALGNSDALSKNTLKTFIGLKEFAGVTAETLGKTYQYSKFLGQESGKFTKELLTQIKIQKDTLGVSVDQNQAFDEIVSTSTLTKTLLGGSTKAITNSYMSAKKLGIELDKVLDTSKALLDLDQSLQQEMELFLLTGKQFDFNQMRIFAMTQNIDGLTQMQSQLGDVFFQDAKNNIFVRQKLEAMGYNIIDQEGQRIANAKTEKEINQDILKTALQQQKSFSEGLTNFNRYILGIRAQGGETFFKLGQKIDLFKAKILGGLSGAIGRSVDTFISKNGTAIENLSDKILKLFNKISEKGGVLELLLDRIFEFFTGDKIKEGDGIMGALNRLFEEGGPIDTGLENFKRVLEGKADVPDWMQKAIDVFNSLKIILEELFKGIGLYAETLVSLKGENVIAKQKTLAEKKTKTLEEKTEVDKKIKDPSFSKLTQQQQENLRTRAKDANDRITGLEKEIQRYALRSNETAEDAAKRINQENIDNWKTSWLGDKVTTVVNILDGVWTTLKLIAAALGVVAVVTGVKAIGQAYNFTKGIATATKVKQASDAVKAANAAKQANNATKAANVGSKVKPPPYAGYGSRSAQALAQNKLPSGKFAPGFKPPVTSVPPTSNVSTLGKLLNNPATKLASNIAGKALAALTPVLGGFVGASQAEQTGRSKTEATILGALTGTATTGSMLSSYVPKSWNGGIEKGSGGDKALGFGTSVGGGALTGAAIGSAFFGVGAVPGAIVGGIVGALAEGWKIFTEEDRTRELQEKQEKEQLKIIEKEKKAQEYLKQQQIRYFADQKVYLDKEFEQKRISQKEYEKHLVNLQKQFASTGLTQKDADKANNLAGFTKLGLNFEASVRDRIFPNGIQNITLAQSKDVRGHFLSAPLFVYVVGGELAAQVRGRVETIPVMGTPDDKSYFSAKQSKGLYGTLANDFRSGPTSLERTILVGDSEYDINPRDTILAGNFPNKETSINQVKLSPFGTLKLPDFSQKQKKTQTSFLPPYLQVNKIPQAAKFIPGPVKLTSNLPYSDENTNTLPEKNTQIFNTPPSSPSTLSSQAVESLNKLNRTLEQLANSMNNSKPLPPIEISVVLDKQKVGEFAVNANEKNIASKNSLTYKPYSFS